MKFIIRWLSHNGFLGPLCTKYRVTIYGDGTLGVDRRYRFRWQPLVAAGAPPAPAWRHKAGRLRFPTAAAMQDSITLANRRADRERLARVVVSRYRLDAADAADAAPGESEQPSRLILPGAGNVVGH